MEKILVFAGAAGRPALEEAALLFEKKTGVKVEVFYGGSGYLLSQMLLSKSGDIYFPTSSEYIEMAKRKNAVLPETERRLAYLVPVINVQKGNPKKIKTLKDLLRSDVRVAIANPESVAIGLLAAEIIEKNFSEAERTLFRKKIVNFTGSAEKTAAAISLKMADAVIGWHIFEYWSPDKIETVRILPSEMVRIGYLSAVVSRFTKNKKRATEFIEFLLSSDGKRIFKKHHYFITQKEAIKFARGKTAVR